MQPQGGSSGAPAQSGRGVPPRGSNLNANAPPYCPILRQSGRGIPPRDSSLPVATVPPHSPIPGQVQEVPLAQLFNDARDEAKRTQALLDLVQPQGGSSGAPAQSGRGVPPRGSNLNANAPPYCPILRQSGRGIPPRDSSLPVATVPPHSPIPGQVQEVPLAQLFNDARDEAKRTQALLDLVQPQGGSSGAPAQSGRGVPPRGSNLKAVPLEQLLIDVFEKAKRGPVLIQLSKMRTLIPDFSSKVWDRPNMITLILEEIVRVYGYMNQDEMPAPEDDCYRVACAITLLQPIAMDERVRDKFLDAAIPACLLPFLMNLKESKGFNEVRIASLGVIGSLVEKSNIRAVGDLLKLDIVKLCMRCMEVRSCNLTNIVAVFILARILVTDTGQVFICDNQEQYLAVLHLFASMFKHPHRTPSQKLLFKWVIICYYLFSRNPRLSKSLHEYLPDTFKDGTFRRLFQGDNETLERANQVVLNCHMS